ncbi:MAG: polysaccharide pyruvyl transferase family protein [Nocardiopsaceae bacterium]|nr:polysaccharide pyruvyl transferase family protein [Nocardiopsaceae bacterium]
MSARGRPFRVGLFGRLGSGNLGNDVSAEVVLDYLRREHPDVILDAMCTGPERMRARYGLTATQLFWQPGYHRRLPRPARLAHLLVDKCIDAARIGAWTRRQDLVIVPGMGVLEATLPIRPWEAPYALFLLGACGRLFRTRVALVSVGASPVRERATRFLFDWCARLAHYRSFRDAYSRDVMTERGVGGGRDPLYPDLAFGVPPLPYDPGDPDTVGIGVMDYGGGNDDRDRAAGTRAAYVASLKEFACWLVGAGKRVRLFVGDADDEPVAGEILACLRERFPGLGPDAAAAEPVTTFEELSRAMQGAGVVVCTRFHNVVCAVRLAKPAIALTYARKAVAVMTGAGLAGFCLPARDLTAPAVIAMFQRLERESPPLRERMRETIEAQRGRLDEQFALLSKEFLPGKPGKPDESDKPGKPGKPPRVLSLFMGSGRAG